jgi:hypothetical protein
VNEIDETKVWFFAEPVAKRITVTDADALQNRFEARLVITLMQNGNVGIYATNERDEERLEEWMNKNAPLAQYKRVTDLDSI